MSELAGGAAPTLPGTYLLWFDVAQPLWVPMRTGNRVLLASGSYVYVGSALGPGGLQARLRRHTHEPAQRRPHWHVDYITMLLLPAAMRFVAAPERRECTWVLTLTAAGAGCPAPGFGSSDCRDGCPAHLLSLPRGWSISTLEDLLT